MLQDAKILIVDHNITRFHTYDVFTWLLHDLSRFTTVYETCPNELEEFVKLHDPVEKLRWAYSNFTVEFCKKVFRNYGEYLKIFTEAMHNEDMHYTPTALTSSICDVFSNPHVTGSFLIQSDDMKTYDRYLSEDLDQFKVFKTSNIFDTDMIADIINTSKYTGCFIDNIESVMKLSYHTEGVTYMIPTYRFNFNADGKVAGFGHLTLAELKNKNEYGFFNPYHFTTKREDAKKDESDGADSE